MPRINLLNAKDEPESSAFLDTLGSNLILPQILLPTRITEDSQTLIDYIFSTASPLTFQVTFIFQSLTTCLNSVFIDRNQLTVQMSLNKTGHYLTMRSLL